MLPQLVWFKRDLRLHDHAALSGAAARGPVLPLYIYEPEQLGHPEFHPSHLSVLNDALTELGDGLARLGAPLIIRRGEALEVVRELYREYGLAALWAHQETGNGVSHARDRRVRAWARAVGLPFYEPLQNGVVRRLRSRDSWAEEWEARMGVPELPVPVGLRGVEAPAGRVLGHAELGLPRGDKELPWAAGTFGERLARETLTSFLKERGANYRRGMSSPSSAETACSRLSVHLAYGTLGLRTAVRATRQRLAEVSGEERADPRWGHSLWAFESRLHWHCHFIQRLESKPGMEFRGLNAALADLRPATLADADDATAERFRAWAAGRSGFPLPDACMRMLLHTGWLNFRMRAMLTSVATQQLWLPWRAVGLHLARHWLDNEPGIHWSQLQMQSGMVGINRLRIYSPLRQAREQDPGGSFIRRWLPELSGLPGAYAHQPEALPPLLQAELGFVPGRDYPLPAVEAGAAARLARERLEAAGQSGRGRAEAQRVYHRHGSRKKAELRRERGGSPSGQPIPTPSRSPQRATQQRALQRRSIMSTQQPPLFGDEPEPAAPTASPAANLSTLPESWQAALLPVMATPEFQRLLAFVEEERSIGPVYPAPGDVFTALRLTPLPQVRVLILGQDPYHGPGQAHGLSFSVRPGVRPPPSLQNIYRELATDVDFKPPRHGDLRSWARQGVLLLNAVLTVRQG
ncbi:MAG: FAD-binding domain-containing protein, partial [Deinococcus sp.]